MKGSVTKYMVKGSSRPKWRYRLRLGRDEHGNHLREGKGGFAKEGEARDAMDVHIAEIKNRKDHTEAPAAPKVGLGEWLSKWIETYAIERCCPTTIERYRKLARYLTTATDGELGKLAAVPLPELKHRPIETALYELLHAPRKRRAHLSARTVRHVAGLLNVALNKAFRLEMIPVNPMLRVELPKVQRSQVRSLTASEIRALRDICRTDWTFTLVELALATGARRGELLALDWPSVDWAGRSVNISKSLEQTEGGLRIKTTKSEKPRHFALPQTAIVALQFQRDQQAEHKRQFGPDYEDNGLVFCEPNGAYLQPDLISQVIVRRLKKAGIKNASLHTLRHYLPFRIMSRRNRAFAVSHRI